MSNFLGYLNIWSNFHIKFNLTNSKIYVLNQKTSFHYLWHFNNSHGLILVNQMIHYNIITHVLLYSSLWYFTFKMLTVQNCQKVVHLVVKRCYLLIIFNEKIQSINLILFQTLLICMHEFFFEFMQFVTYILADYSFDHFLLAILTFELLIILNLFTYYFLFYL